MEHIRARASKLQLPGRPGGRDQQAWASRPILHPAGRTTRPRRRPPRRPSHAASRHPRTPPRRQPALGQGQHQQSVVQRPRTGRRHSAPPGKPSNSTPANASIDPQPPSSATSRAVYVRHTCTGPPPTEQEEKLPGLLPSSHSRASTRHSAPSSRPHASSAKLCAAGSSTRRRRHSSGPWASLATDSAIARPTWGCQRSLHTAPFTPLDSDCGPGLGFLTSPADAITPRLFDFRPAASPLRGVRARRGDSS